MATVGNYLQISERNKQMHGTSKEKKQLPCLSEMCVQPQRHSIKKEGEEEQKKIERILISTSIKLHAK